MRSFIICISIATLNFLCSAHAAIYYRHPPFALTVQPTDQIIVEYDFSNKVGINCSANNPFVKIDFIYKGHQKTANIPASLESSHIPEMANEQLADSMGQVKLTMLNPQIETYTITCDYLK